MRHFPLILICLLSLSVTDGLAAAPSRLARTLPGKVDTGRSIALSADVTCAPRAAYDLWATTDGVAKFFAPKSEIGAVGGPYTIVFYPDDDPEGVRHGTAGARVLAREPGRFLAFEWVTFAGDSARLDGRARTHGQRLPEGDATLAFVAPRSRGALTRTGSATTANMTKSVYTFFCREQAGLE
jgi:hypothetical protein